VTLLHRDVSANQLLDDVAGRDRPREFVDARFDRLAVADDLDVDERHVFVADDSGVAQMAQDQRRALSLAHLHVFDRLRVAFVRSRQRAPEEISAAGGQQRREEHDGEKRLEVLAAAAGAPRHGPRYGCLRCASRYDCRITAAAAMSMFSLLPAAIGRPPEAARRHRPT
jgi:hypothetical protein